MPGVLDPQARRFLDELEASGTPMPWDPPTVAEARAALVALQVTPDEPIPVGRVEERAIPTSECEILTRIFTPPGDGPFPALVWFHGGGWVVGSLDESDAVCRALCAMTGSVVLCPDYRMAPEHPFPAAAEDSYAVTAWAHEHAASLGCEPGVLAVAGDSAGGNLAAVVALMARDRGGPPLAFQLLVYPVVGTPADGRASYAEFAEGYFLTRAGMEWFTELYAASADDLESPYLAPLRADDLRGLPPAMVITAEFDPLRDEGEEYARRLQEAGVACELHRYDGQIHAFFILPDEFDAARAAQEVASAALRDAFANVRRDRA